EPCGASDPSSELLASPRLLSRSLGRRGLLAARDAHPARPLAGSRVRLGALASGRQVAPVPETAVGADLLQPLDVLRALTAKVTLPLAALDSLTQLHDLVLGQVLDRGVGIHAR